MAGFALSTEAERRVEVKTLTSKRGWKYHPGRPPKVRKNHNILYVVQRLLLRIRGTAWTPGRPRVLHCDEPDEAAAEAVRVRRRGTEAGVPCATQAESGPRSRDGAVRRPESTRVRLLVHHGIDRRKARVHPDSGERHHEPPWRAAHSHGRKTRDQRWPASTCGDRGGAERTARVGRRDHLRCVLRRRRVEAQPANVR